jgi:hypothetical protein
LFDRFEEWHAVFLPARQADFRRGVGLAQRALMGVEFSAGFHDADRVAADRAFGSVRFQDGGQLMERAASVAPAAHVDEAFVIELVVDGVPVGLERSLVVPEELDRGFVAARANELVGKNLRMRLAKIVLDNLVGISFKTLARGKGSRVMGQWCGKVVSGREECDEIRIMGAIIRLCQVFSETGLERLRMRRRYPRCIRV